jgi:hypothetical protein
MPKKLEKSAANLERIAQDKIGTIRLVMLHHAGRGEAPVNGTRIGSRQIETAVFESLQVRKALKRLRRIQAKRLRKAGIGK